MKHQGQPRREKLKFSGRELVDGVPHLTWKPEGVEGRGRHRAEVPEWKWGFAVDAFKEATVGNPGRDARGQAFTGSALRVPAGTSTTPLTEARAT